MDPRDTQLLTLEADASQLPDVDALPRTTLVFRWDGGRELADMDRATTLTVGRGSACELRIEDPSLSRQHARFVREADGLRVEDLDSRNGVTVRGRRVKRALLESGDVLRMGNVVVSVHIFAPAPTQSPSVSGPEIDWTGAGMTALRRSIEKIAPTPLPVLVLGETGCGKELIAREIHRLSHRASAPLRIVNCAAIPATLIESTLFGHEKGAFTGADRVQAGVFEQASHGTIFLDEIGELSLAAQAALLRVLETGRFTRVGATRELEADARVVAATHRDLHGMVDSGAFRLDLLHRLDAVSVTLPPLRERPDAIDSLIDTFLVRAQRTLGSTRKTLSHEALELMRAYAWPGNVRELRNAVERAVAISDTDIIQVADLPDRLHAPPKAPAPSSAATPTLPPKGDDATQERELIVRTLQETDGDQEQAAAKLGWSLRTLQRRVQQHGLSKARK